MSISSQEEKIMNGVNVTQLFETIKNVKNQPDLADFKFRAENTWINGGHNRITVNNYFGTQQEISRKQPFTFDADEPPVLLGGDKGANPVEYLLTALSSCMTTSLAYHAASRGIEIESISSKFEGDIDLKGFLDIDPKIRKGYKEIRVNFKVKSDAEAEQLEELLKKSPVYDVVTNPTPVKITIETERV